MPSPRTTFSRLEQCKKAPSPKYVTLSGIVMLSRLVHPEKAEPTMFVTLFGMDMLSRLVQL